MQSSQRVGIKDCEKHLKPILCICTSPQCLNYRQLCQECLKTDKHHSQMHLKKQQAVDKVQKDIDHLFKGLKALRTKIMDRMGQNQHKDEGLNEISENLQKIKKKINEKIDYFHESLKKKYSKEIKHKLHDLFSVVEKSHEFLDDEKRKLYKTGRLQPFFVNDLNHDLNYYESFFEELLQKNVRKFKKGFQNDKILKMIVTFEQNLSQIFTDQGPGKIQQQPHIFTSDDKSHYLYKFKNSQIYKEDLTIDKKEEEGWVGSTPSIYYSPKDCYYIFGEGKKQSQKIKKLQGKFESDNPNITVFSTKMQIKRTNFSVCLLNHEIFIVGGQNKKEGCLMKCEKFVPSEGKTYFVNSLNRKSARHNLCTLKDEYILKFGGTDLMESLLNEDRFHPLPPQIYSLQTQQWRTLQIPESRMNFGLRPGVFCLQQNDQIIVLQGQNFKKKVMRDRYVFTFEFSSYNKIRDIKLVDGKTLLSTKNMILSNFWEKDENIIRFITFQSRIDKFQIQRLQI